MSTYYAPVVVLVSRSDSGKLERQLSTHVEGRQMRMYTGCSDKWPKTVKQGDSWAVIGKRASRTEWFAEDSVAYEQLL